MSVVRRERIRALNDRLRRLHTGGRIFISQGLVALGGDIVRAALVATQEFSRFDETNDPYGEHDFGAVTVGKHRVFWKIDYYDQSLTSSAVDPSQEQGCVRVLTLMLAQEY